MSAENVLHIIITIESFAIFIIFFRTFNKTKDNNFLFLAVVFLIVTLGNSIHAFADIQKLNFWMTKHLDHLTMVLSLIIFIWVIWPRNRWQKEIERNRLKSSMKT